MKHALALALLVLLAVGSSKAQEIHASILGIVTDPSGAAIPGASVAATHVDTGLRLDTTAGADGTYFLTRLPRGNYRLTVEATGFRQYVREAITLNAGDKADVAVRLELGLTTESVTVSAALTGIEANESVLGQVMGNKTVAELPLNGRNFIMLLQLSTGVVFTNQKFGPGGWTMPNQYATGSGTGAAFTMHGGRPGTNAFMLDGATQGMEGGPAYIPPPEAVEDLKVATPTFDASHGISGGGVVNVTMKSGTNQFHGMLGHFFRNNVLNANFIQTNRAAASRPELGNPRSQFNNFVVLVSGPIVRNKLFYSANFDGYRLRQANAVTVTVPTMQQRAGDFSGTFNAARQLVNCPSDSFSGDAALGIGVGPTERAGVL